MGLDFPNSPTLNQVFPASALVGVVTWMWDGSAWTSPPLIPKVVLVNAVGSKLYTASGTSATYTGITIAAGSNRALVVTISWDGPATTPTAMSMTWDSGGTNQAMTRIVTSDPGGHTGTQSELWGLVNPVVGNKTLAMSWTSAAHGFISSIAFNGVDQTGGATSFPNSTSSTSAMTLTVTSATSDFVVCCCGTGAGMSPTGTIIFTDGVSGSTINAYANYDNGAASVVIGGVGAGAIVATDVKAG
jgi:hypothetical protein